MNDYEKETILNYLNPSQPFDFMNSERYSTLIAGLRDCRAHTKREVGTGKHNPIINYGDEGNWLGAIGYFTILDQIGSCYKMKGTNEPPEKTSSIRFAIESFGFDLIDNNDKKLHALIALRNAFTHDFNLLNTPFNPKFIDLEQHKFTVTADINDKWIVKLPSKQWNGNIEGKNFLDTSDSTFINLFGFGEMVESIFSNIFELVSKDAIDLRVSMIKLINKYTFVTSDHPIK